MKKTRRALAFCLSLLMVFSASPVWAFAQDTPAVYTGTDLYNSDVSWVYEEETATMTVSGAGNFSGYLTDADRTEYEGSFVDDFYVCTLILEEGVTSLGTNDPEKDREVFFVSNTELTEIRFPDHFEESTFFEGYFDGCKALTTVRLPKTMQSIPESMFHNCTALTEITLPEQLTAIGDNAFSGCKILKTIALPQGLENIGTKAFYNCSALTAISLPDNVCDIADDAFYGCKKLDEITFSDHLKSIGDRAFYNCGLTSVVLLDSVESIGPGAFSRCSALTSVELPSGLTAIPSQAFCDCTALSEIRFPESLKSIGAEAFFGSALQSLTLPDSVEYVGVSAFASCPLTDGVHIGGGLSSISENMFENAGLTSIEIPSNITCIESSAFYGCESLVSVQLPEKMTSVGDYAFENCTSLAQINWPSVQVPDIADYTFRNCKALEVFDFPDGLQVIGKYAFYRTGLKDIYLPESITRVKSNAFQYSDLSDTLQVVDYNSTVTFETGAFANTNLAEFILYPKMELQGKVFANSQLKLVAIEEGVQAIGDSAFQDCKALTEVMLSDSVTSIGNSAFQNCTALTEINLPDSVTEIGNYAFSNCAAITGIAIPNSVTSIGSYAFENSGLETLFIPGSVQSIGDYAFSDCTSLVNVKMDNGANGLGRYVFANCTAVESYTLPASLRDIPQYSISYRVTKASNTNTITVSKIDSLIIAPKGSQAIDYAKQNNLRYEEKLSFDNIPENYISGYVGSSGGYWLYDPDNRLLMIDALVPSGNFTTEDGEIWDPAAYGVESISFGSDVTSIPANRFKGLESLKSVVVADSVTAIGAGAFQDCANLASVSLGNGVTQIGNSAFSGCTNLQAIQMSDSLISIGTEAFKDCAALTQIDLGDAVTTVGDNAFRGCAALQAVTFSGPVAIGNTAFYGDAALQTVGFGKNTVSIGKSAFENCTSLNAICLPDSVTALGQSAFRGCSAATGIEVGSGLTNLPAYAFADCTSLKDITLSDNLVTIGSNAFENAVKLKFIRIPDGVTTIESRAFAQCLNAEKITLGASVTTIGTRAFDNCVNCYELNLNSKINEMRTGDYTTYHMEYYCGTNPVIPTSGLPYDPNTYDFFLHIGENTSGLTVNIGDNVDKLSIHWLAAQTDNLTCLNIGSGVSGVAYKDNRYVTADYTKRFAAQLVGNNNLREIHVSEENPYLYADGTAIYSKDKTVLYAAAPSLDTFEVKYAQTVGEYAFAGNVNLKKVTFSSTVQAIDSKAFKCCPRLKYVELPKTLTAIGTYAFYNCPALKILEIPGSVGAIGSYAFAECRALSSVILREGIESIQSYAFKNCTALTGVVVPDSLSTFYQGAFYSCTALEEVYIGAQSGTYVLTTQDKTHVFERCSALTIYTMAGSDASVYAKTRKIPCVEYTDADTFADLCAMKLDIYAGYLGFCTDGHGDIEWLTVYAADCENDGYEIGVCEYCSEILDEKHITASGHDYKTTRVEPTQTADGMVISTCANCGKSHCETLPNLSGVQLHETHQVSGSVMLASNRSATSGKNAAIGADIIINGFTVATTDQDGNFRFALESGTYEMTVHYAYGFDRTVYISVGDRDVVCGSIPIIGCDWNKDGRIDNADYIMFKIIFNAYIGSPSYLEYVDMNHDGFINIRDMVIVERCMGLNQNNYAYPQLAFQ